MERQFDSAEPTHEPTGAEMIVGSVRQSNIVAIVSLDDVESSLVEGGTWIRTRMTGTVDEVLRSSPEHVVARKEKITMEFNGGELMIHDVLVKAYPLRLVKGRQYLWFVDTVNGYLSDDRTSKTPVAVYRPLLVENGRLKDTWPSDAPERVERPLDGLKLGDVVKQIRRVKP